MNKSKIVFFISIILMIFLSYRIGSWITRYKYPIYVTEIDNEIIPIDSVEILGLSLKPNLIYKRIITKDIIKTTNGFLFFKDSVVNTNVQLVSVKK